MTETSTGHIVIKFVEFVEMVKYYLKTTEYPGLGGNVNNIVANYDNLPYYGHGYILDNGNYLTISIENTLRMLIKTCNKFDAEISLTTDGNFEENLKYFP